MKILLINPPRSPHNAILEYAPEEARRFIHKKLIGPPLGLITIAAAVKEHEVRVVDLKGEYDLVPDAPPQEVLVKNYVREFQPGLVGVTFIASEYDSGIRIFRAIKEINPEIYTVAGGLHCTLCPQDFKDKPVDFICPGHSAGVFRELVEALEEDKNLREIPGLIIHREGELIYNAPVAGWDAAGKDFIMPDRNQLKRWISTYHVGGNPSPVTYLFTSLGCPYHCSFCSIWKQHCGVFLQRKPESIIEELKSIPEYGVVRFADANTIVNADFIDDLFDRIAAEGIRKDYVMDIRFDTAVQYPALIEKLARNGLKVVICGFESFRDEELKRYRKGSSSALIEKAIDIFHANGISLRGNYVVPPEYTADDFKALADYASAHRVVYAGYTILTPMPGTDYYEEVKTQIIDHDLSKYNFFNCVLPTSLPLEEFYRQVGSLWLIKKGEDVI